MNPDTYGHLIFDKGVEKKTAFSTNGAVATGSYHVKPYELIYSYLLAQSSSLSGSRNST
jgi:hypothetical protein